MDRSLDALCHGGVQVLHDRRVLGVRERADHIAVAASGVWVISSRQASGRVAIREARFGKDRLMVGDHDCSKLIDTLDRQVAAARTMLRTFAPAVPVHGALCFIDAELPALGALSFRGYPVLHPRALARLLNEDGPIDELQTSILAQRLERRFPPA